MINRSHPAPATSVNVKLASGSWEEDSDSEADMVEVSVEVTVSEVAWVEDMEERLIMGNNAGDILILYCDGFIDKLFEIK